MGVVRIPLMGGPWDGSSANVRVGHVPPDPYKVEVRESEHLHFYTLRTLTRKGKTEFEYHYSHAEKQINDQSGK